jgi:mannose-6-phosphate isomerase-like protein (cupin superfamily)
MKRLACLGAGGSINWRWRMKSLDQVKPLAIDEKDAPQDGWDDSARGKLRWRTLFSKGATASEGMTCGVAEFRTGEWLGLHRHASAEIYYIFAGAGLMSLDGREIPVKAGSAVFIPGMVEHGMRQTGNEVLRLFYAFPVDSFDGVEYLFSAAPRG